MTDEERPDNLSVSSLSLNTNDTDHMYNTLSDIIETITLENQQMKQEILNLKADLELLHLNIKLMKDTYKQDLSKQQAQLFELKKTLQNTKTILLQTMKVYMT